MFPFPDTTEFLWWYSFRAIWTAIAFYQSQIRIIEPRCCECGKRDYAGRMYPDWEWGGFAFLCETCSS